MKTIVTFPLLDLFTIGSDNDGPEEAHEFPAVTYLDEMTENDSSSQKN
jgi:hypothetical protein